MQKDRDPIRVAGHRRLFDALIFAPALTGLLWTHSIFAGPSSPPFTNLNFELATVSTLSSGQSNLVSVSSALPCWTVTYGSQQQSQVLQNGILQGAVSVDLLGPNLAVQPYTSGVLDGNYSAELQAGLFGGSLVSASISEDGTVPYGSESLQFLAWTDSSTAFLVSFDGTVLTPIALGSGPDGSTLYGVDISPYQGVDGMLLFSMGATTSGQQNDLVLDDINFSPTPVPEPTSMVLTGIGALLLAFRRRCFGR
jgi:hypothetical protein